MRRPDETSWLELAANTLGGLTFALLLFIFADEIRGVDDNLADL